MSLSRPVLLLTIPLFFGTGFCAAQERCERQSTKQSSPPDCTGHLKLLHFEGAHYPDEAVRKKVEGTVKMSIVVDAKGNVLAAKALSGPSELVPAAIAAARRDKFEPPASAPCTDTTQVSFGFPKECPGPISEFGDVSANGQLLDRGGKVVAVWVMYGNPPDVPLPRYPDEERKAGVAGEMVLGVTLDASAGLTGIKVLKSLSPRLDQGAMDTVRQWKFKWVDENHTSPSQVLELTLWFHARCISFGEN